MFKKIKEYFNTKKNIKEAKKLLILNLINFFNEDYDTFKTSMLSIANKHFDLLVAETETKKAEKKAYESMITFGDNFNVEDLQKLIGGIDTIANNPNLTTEYYKDVAKRANKEKVKESKIEVVK